MEQFAKIVRKLDAIQEGEQTAITNCTLMYCSSMSTGSHDETNLPCVVVEGAYAWRCRRCDGQLWGGFDLL